MFTCHNSQDHLEDLFPISTSNVAGGVDLDLTLRFPDHIALGTGREHGFSEILIKSKCSVVIRMFSMKPS